TLSLAGASGALSAITGITVNAGGTLTLDNTTANNTNRIVAAAPITLNGGTFNFLGSSTAGARPTSTRAPTLGGGNSPVNVTGGSGQNAALTFGSLTRNAGATVNFTAGSGQTLSTASNQILFTTAPTLAGSIIKGATTTDNASGGFNLATYAG